MGMGPDGPSEPRFEPGQLVYIHEEVDEDGVGLPGIGRVVEDLGDVAVVMVLDPIAFLDDRRVEVGEQEILTEYLVPIVDDEKEEP